MLTPPMRPGLLPRLVVDSVLPCALVAWVMIGAVTFYRVQNIDDRAHLVIATQLQRLVTALDRADDQAAQALLDDAMRSGRAIDLKGIELRDANGNLLQSGRVDMASLERYPSDLTARHGQLRRLTAHVDPVPRRHAQHVARMYGLGAGLGVLLLTWLAIRALRYRVIQPLQRLQRRMNEIIAGTAILASNGNTEAHAEFAQLQAASATLHRLLEARGREATLIRRDSGIEVLDQRRQSRAALRGKAQFVALVGHHFRQPLQALQLFAGSLHPGIDAEQQAVIGQMRSSVADMTQLLDALLEISRLDAGVVAAHPASIDAVELFMHWRAELGEIARGAAVTLHWHVAAHTLVGDAELIGALLVQLVSNAVAWSPPQGRVLIAARPRGDRIRIEVRDHGPGIAAIHHQRIFEEFVRLHDEGERRRGYGLGLAIAARLARLLQTEIGLRSEPGRGSTFFFELSSRPPLGTAEQAVPAGAEMDEDTHGAASTRDHGAVSGPVSTFALPPSSKRAMS
ncbi:MAG: HAMP domain-containing sensor histidine kinase [Rhodanobacter sp.]